MSVPIINGQAFDIIALAFKVVALPITFMLSTSGDRQFVRMANGDIQLGRFPYRTLFGDHNYR